MSFACSVVAAKETGARNMATKTIIAKIRLLIVGTHYK
jgi:hypothetical protein